MNEEHAVLDFFAKEENLPLALAVADLVDVTRKRMNNEFWSALAERIGDAAPAWQVTITEDRNAPEYLVGIYLQPRAAQATYLRPMLEQQFIGGMPRIYFGLMWSAAPEPRQKDMDAVVALRDAMQQQGFKTNDSFLAWQWSPYFPRSKKFLMRLSASRNSLLEETAGMLLNMLRTHGNALDAINTALREAPRNTAISLDSLRANLRQENTRAS